MQHKMLPSVSIIIPYKEDRGYLEQALDSIHAQTYRGEIEVILSQSDNGVSYNLNNGIKRATGDYIKYLCDDDELTPNSILDSVNAIQGYDFLHGNAVNFFEDGREETYIPPVKDPNLARMILGNVIHGGSLMYRADVFADYGLFDETLTTGEEYDFNMMLLSKGAKLGYCDKPLYRYRRHDQQKSLGVKANQAHRRTIIEQIRRRYV